LQTVDIYTPWGEKKFLLPVPGYHNALNALAVITLLSSIGYDINDVMNSFYDFRLPDVDSTSVTMTLRRN